MLSDRCIATRSIGGGIEQLVIDEGDTECELVESDENGQRMRRRKRRRRRLAACEAGWVSVPAEEKMKTLVERGPHLGLEMAQGCKRDVQESKARLRVRPRSAQTSKTLFHLNLIAFVALSVVVLSDWSCRVNASDHQSAADNQTNTGSSDSKSTPIQSAPQVSSNMSAIMSSAPVQVMTNSSIMAMMGQQQQQQQQNFMQMANQSASMVPDLVQQARPGQTTNSSLNSAQFASPKYAATKGGQQPGSRSQQQAAANSPAFNSRQKTQPAGSLHRSDQQASRHQRPGGGPHSDNQMAADDMHETQATLMPAAQDDESKLARAPGGGGLSRQPSSSPSSPDASRPQAMAMVNSGGKPIMPAPSANKQPTGKSLAPSAASQSSASADNWQVVSTSVPNPSSSSPAAATPPSASWPPRSRGQSGGDKGSQKYLPPPPPPINYNNFYRQHLSEQTSANAYQHQQLMQQGAPTGDQLEGTQLERPYSGYSYGSSAYTHTAQLAPVRQELELANGRSAASNAVKQRQRQFVPPVEQLARSSSSTNGHLEQQQISPAGSGPPSRPAPPNQLPQFHSSSSVHYSQQPPPSVQSGTQQQQQHKQHVQLSMMPPPPQPPVTGTHSSPCKPPPLLQLGLQQQQLQEQLLLANDLASAASSQQGSPSGMPKYVRLSEGTRLRSQFIFKVLRADSLTDCELACARASLVAGENPLDTCRSFNYRAYFAAENCELSRSDARQLKLDDAAQFEQHTQFDFYALASGSPPGLAPSASSSMQQALAQLQQAPIVQQQVAPYTPAAPSQEADCLDVSQSCSQDGMEFTLRTLEPFMGRIYTYGFYESCYLDGEGQTSNTLKISRSNGFPRCGTQQIGDLMTNIVVVQFNDHVQTTRDKKYNLTCYFSGPGEAVVTSSYFDTKLDERSHPMQIEHLPPQNVITSNVQLRILHHGTPTNTIAVGDLLTFRLETQSAGGGGGGSSSGVKQSRASQAERQHEIFATNVIAKDPYSGRQVQLIDGRGCPVDPVNVFPELQRTTDGALESEFYAFKMPDSNFLIFQATVRACKSPCEPVICHRTLGGGPPTLGGNSLQQYQLASGIKGAGGGQLGAYLMAATQQNAVPSWGRRRRRKRQSLEGAQSILASDASSAVVPDDELLGEGESVEHVIPARLVGGGGGTRRLSDFDEPAAPRMVTRVKRPELSEAEEEVKEMFRVYLTRAEINNKRRLAQQQQLKDLELAGESGRGGPRSGSLVSNSTGTDSWRLTDASHPDSDAAAAAGELSSQVCLTQAGYYVMLFSIISLSLVMLSVLTIALYITRKAKFHISETLADAMF